MPRKLKRKFCNTKFKNVTLFKTRKDYKRVYINNYTLKTNWEFDFFFPI